LEGFPANTFPQFIQGTLCRKRLARLQFQKEVAERVNEAQGCIPFTTRWTVLLIPEGSFQTGGAGGCVRGCRNDLS